MDEAEQTRPELPPEPIGVPTPDITNAKMAEPSYYRERSAEEEIAQELSDIRYRWGRISEIAKRQQRLTAQ